ncbi:hypothetical protein [Winogradskyella thalassocola]|uniref:Uncharacterized protein n=1 Tax=Winogradskyella thalassocola TaxID=262004 RepID=A0A1G7YCD9_9FLAO|nr:hypothetical protein [Winogradskyella thalassocola]SDG93986.1 hypothetical protein SAMN04489796_101988 [Winogradskyella thalassocola]
MKNLIILITLILCTNNALAQVGIGTTDPKSTLDINGNLSLKVVSLNGGPSGAATSIDDGVYINLTPTFGNADFELPDPRTVPGRIYILRNITDTETAYILTQGAGVEFFAGDSTSSTTVVNMTTAVGGGNLNKTLIFISDGSNWTYGKLGF